MVKCRCIAFIFCCWLACARLLGASLLPNGSLVTPTVEDTLAGATLLASPTVLNITGSKTPSSVKATITCSVYNQDAHNPWGLDASTFTYVIENTSTTATFINLNTNGFAGYQTDVSYYVAAGGGTISPRWMQRLQPPDGNSLGMQFDKLYGHTDIGPGQKSVVVVVQTDATTYGAVTGASKWSTDNWNGTLLGPAGQPVPQPSAALGGSMLLAAVCLWRVKGKLVARRR